MSKQGLPPLLCENPRILILGSLPGDKSIEMQQYYGHPHNRFWQVMASVLGNPLPEDYEAKKKLLSDAGQKSAGFLLFWPSTSGNHAKYCSFVHLWRVCPKIPRILARRQKKTQEFLDILLDTFTLVF